MNKVHVFSLTLKLEVSNYTTERLGWDNTLCTMGDREVVLCHLFDRFEFDIMVRVALRLCKHCLLEAKTDAFEKLRQHV